MKRRLVTYFPIAVLASGLFLGMAAAFMVFYGFHGAVEASSQQVVDNNSQVISLGLALVGPGDKISTSATFATKFSDAYGEQSFGLGLESAHLTEPIDGQSTAATVYFHDVNNTGTLTLTITLTAIPVQSQNLTFTNDRVGAVTNIDDMAGVPVQGLNVNGTINRLSTLAYPQGNTIEAMHLRHGGALGGVGTQLPRIACTMCKGGAYLFSDDSSVRLTGTKEVSPDGLPSGIRVRFSQESLSAY